MLKFARTIALCLPLAGMLFAAGCGEEGGPMTFLDIEPPNGAKQGDQPIKIHGRNFRTEIGYTIWFGTQQAERVAVMNDELMVVRTPRAEEAGAVDIQIIADDGPGFVIRQGFRYEEGGGSPIEGIGGGAAASKMGNLAY